MSVLTEIHLRLLLCLLLLLLLSSLVCNFVLHTNLQLRAPFKYVRYHVFFFFVMFKPVLPSCQSAPPELAAGEVWCGAVQAREQGSPGPWAPAWGWARTEAGQDVRHTGEPGSAEPMARRGRTVGRRRLTGLRVCWDRD